MPKRLTQADVAELAGVSRATVSYVLNDHTDGRIHITDETRQRVIKAAQKLGYEPNALARSLRFGFSRTVGLLIPDTQNPHYMDILSGVEEEVLRHGYYLVLVSASLDPERERHCLRSLFERRLDGLLLAPTFADVFQDEIDLLLERTRPVVFCSLHQYADCVYADVHSGAVAMMDHLIGLGHRRIGLIDGVARRDMASDRLNTYQEKMAASGVAIDESLIRHCGHTTQDGYFAAQELLNLDPPPTSIWAINDLLAIGALRAIHERSLRIPEDISLAGFDDILLAAQLYPPLTTVQMHGEEMGRRAAQVLFQRIKSPEHEPMQETTKTTLVVRQSTGPAKET